MPIDRQILQVLLQAKNELRGPLNEAQSDLQRFRGGVVGIGTAFRVAGAVAAASTAVIAGVTGRLIQQGRELQALETRLGISAAALSELRFVADLSNVTFQSLATGLQRMTRRLAEAAGGFGEAQRALDELGLDAQELLALPLVEQFEAVGNALLGVEDSSERVALAFKFFDTEGVGLLQTLSGASGTLKDMRKLSVDVGVALDQQTIRAADRAGRQFVILGAAVQGVGNALAREFLPLLTEDRIGAATESVVKLGRAFRGLGEDIEGVLDFLNRFVQNLGDAFGTAPVEIDRFRDSIEQARKAAEDAAAGFRPTFAPSPIPVETGTDVREPRIAEGAAGAFSDARAEADRLLATMNRLVEAGALIKDNADGFRIVLFDGLPLAQELAGTTEEIAGRVRTFSEDFEELPGPLDLVNQETTKLLDTTEQYSEIVEDLPDLWKQSKTAIEEVQRQQAILLDDQELLGARLTELAFSLSDSLSGAFADALIGARTFREGAIEAIRAVGRAIIQEIARIMARAAALGFLKLLQTLFGGLPIPGIGGGGPGGGGIGIGGTNALGAGFQLPTELAPDAPEAALPLGVQPFDLDIGGDVAGALQSAISNLQLERLADDAIRAIAELPPPVVSVPAPLVSVPAIQVPEIAAPDVSVNVPEFPSPPAAMVNVPEIEAPSVSVATPRVEVMPPSVSVDVPEVGAPQVTVGAPDVPEISVPDVRVELPEIRVPPVEFDFPEVPAPTVSVAPPGVSVSVPQPVVELPEGLTVGGGDDGPPVPASVDLGGLLGAVEGLRGGLAGISEGLAQQPAPVVSVDPAQEVSIRPESVRELADGLGDAFRGVFDGLSRRVELGEESMGVGILRRGEADLSRNLSVASGFARGLSQVQAPPPILFNSGVSQRVVMGPINFHAGFATRGQGVALAREIMGFAREAGFNV